MRDIVESVVKQVLEEQEYDHTQAKIWSETIVQNVRDQAKQLSIPSYKIVVQTVIGQVKGQGVRVASKCLWDEENDNFSSFTFSNHSLFCTTIVFGIYYE